MFPGSNLWFIRKLQRTSGSLKFFDLLFSFDHQAVIGRDLLDDWTVAIASGPAALPGWRDAYTILLTDGHGIVPDVNEADHIIGGRRRRWRPS